MPNAHPLLFDEPDPLGAHRAKLDRCEQLSEDFCIVTESVRQGIPLGKNSVAPKP